MKPVHRIIAIVTLGCAAMTAGTSAQAEDTATCRGGYSMLLMTPEECQRYLDQLKEVRARSDRMAELELQEWHTALLIQRAEACLCQEGTPILLSQRRTGR
ncbi:MAG: hypothetical protein ACSLEZ_14250 [Thiobacillus sp.]